MILAKKKVYKDEQSPSPYPYFLLFSISLQSSNSAPQSLYAFTPLALIQPITMAATTTSPTRITVSTTLPLVDNNLPTILSDRLIIRPLFLSDLQEYHTLRSQPETMALSDTGKPDQNMIETQDKLLRLQPPYQGSHVYFGIFLKKEDNHEGQLIGEGGVDKFASTLTGWPEFRFIFKKEHWHLHYEIEFTTTFMEFWWKLPREKTNILAIPTSDSPNLQGTNMPEAKELVYAWTRKGISYQPHTWTAYNVLSRTGFDFEAYKDVLDKNLFHGQLTKDLFYKDKVFTTRPYPPLAGNLPEPIITDLFILRPLLLADLEAYHSLRKDPEVLHLLKGGQGKPDENKSETESETRKMLEFPDSNKYYFGVFLKKSDDNEGELIGEVGVYLFSNAWPSIYYYLKKKHWGKGYASEFVPSFISFWWSLPRMTTHLNLMNHPGRGFPDKVTEQLTGTVHVENTRSQKVLKKAGFELLEVSESFTDWRYISPKK